MIILTKAQLTGIVTLAMILAGTIVITNPTSTYYCQTEDNVKECLRLSSTNRTCYWLNVNLTIADLCTDGVWKPIIDYINLSIKKSQPKTVIPTIWHCNNNGCY